MARRSPAHAGPVDERIAVLHAEPPERFVAARDALARELAASGDPRAAAVRGLRRPTRRVWLLNRVARERPSEIDALLDAGAKLRAAHAAALHGRRDAGLRAADQSVSHRLDVLVEAAAAIAAAAGHPADHALLVAIRNDLRAVAGAGGEDAARLRRGTLDRAPRPHADDALAAALSASTGLVLPARRGGREKDTGDGERPRGGRREVFDRAALRSGRTAPTAAQDRRADAQRRAARDRAERERDRARRALAAAEAETGRRDAAWRAAERRAGELRKRAAAAEATRISARRGLERAESALAALERSADARAARDGGSAAHLT